MNGFKIVKAEWSLLGRMCRLRSFPTHDPQFVIVGVAHGDDDVRVYLEALRSGEIAFASLTDIALCPATSSPETK